MRLPASHHFSGAVWMWRLPLVTLFTAAVTACAWTPPSITSEEQQNALGRFQHDQAQRQHLGPWRTDGVLRLEEQELSRRLRVSLHGDGQGGARVRIFGPMQQMDGELLLLPNYLEMLYPTRREVWRLPATASGLERLVGIPFPPDALLELFLARAAPLPHPPLMENQWVTTEQGERLRLDLPSGRIMERTGREGSDIVYRVLYDWPDPPSLIADWPLMPSKVRLALEEGVAPVQGTIVRAVELESKPWSRDLSGATLKRPLPPDFLLRESP